MPAPFGLLDTGLSPMRQEEVEASLRARIAAAPALGANINTAAESPMGQLVVLVAAVATQQWELAEAVLAGMNPHTASGTQLDRLGPAFGLSRQGAVASTATLTLAGTPGTVVPAGSAVEDESTGARFATDADATIGGGGTVDVDATAESTGPIQALAGTTWTIATPVSGWTGATNAADAAVGRDIESDASFRRRLLQAATAQSRLELQLLQVAGVTEAIVVENATPFVDLDGRPPHSFEVVARGGTDAAVAAAIWANKPAGIQTTTTVGAAAQVSEVVTDAAGDGHTVVFSRPDVIDVYVEIDYRPRPTFPGDGEARMVQAILDFGAALRIGEGAYPTDVEQAIYCAFSQPAFYDLTLRMGLSASPLDAVPVPANRAELPDFDSARITLTRLT